MEDAWNTARLIGGVIEALVGIFIFASAPNRPANQALGLLLFALGVGPFGIAHAAGNLFFAEGSAGDAASGALSSFGVWALPFLYVHFISQAVPRPNTAWLRTTTGRIGLYFLAAGAGTADLFLPPSTWRAWLSSLLVIAAATFALITSIGQYRRTSGSAQARAREYMIAFALRDAIYIYLSVAVIVGTFTDINYIWFALPVMMFLASDALIVHGLLRGQILALENKVVRAAAGAVAATLLVIAFVVTTEIIEEIVAGQDAVIGIVAAVVLTLTFGPLQRISQRALRSLFPSAKPLAEMSKRERLAEYQEFLELALADGTIDEGERSMLDRMADRLGIDQKTARAMEA